MGFLFVPPYRIQGLSVAGEASTVQVPELDVTFDIGDCPKAVLTSNYVALTHGHMDHAAGLAYYFSQRNFQGMGTGTVVCHPELEQPIHNIMQAWQGVERQKTPYEVKALAPEQELEIKNNTFLRAFETIHTVPSIGFTVVEHRTKLKPELVGLPQEKLVELKQQGQEITNTHHIPLVAYTGDTAWGKHFDRDDVLDAHVLITECTFLTKEDKPRARVGKHLHLDHIIDLLERFRGEAIVLTHMSRRIHMGATMKTLEEALTPEQRAKVLVLMDHRNNRARYEQQKATAGV